MQHKFKLSVTVLMLLGFCLVLFYQNCSQQSEELGTGSTCVGSGCPGGPGPGTSGTNTNLNDSTCTKRSQSPLTYEVNLQVPTTYILTFSADGAPVTAPSIVFQGGEPFANDPMNVMPGGCPAVTLNQDGTVDCGANHSSNSGWVRADCECVRQQGFRSSPLFVGYTNPTWNINRFSGLINNNIRLMTKANDGNPNSTLSPIESATCIK